LSEDTFLSKRRLLQLAACFAGGSNSVRKLTQKQEFEKKKYAKQ